MPFTLVSSRRRGAVVLAPTGDLDVHSASPLREAIAALAGEDSHDAVVIDMAGTDFVDSSALGVLVGAIKQLDAVNRKFALVCTKPHLIKVFRITRLSDVIPIYSTIDAAAH